MRSGKFCKYIKNCNKCLNNINLRETLIKKLGLKLDPNFKCKIIEKKLNRELFEETNIEINNTKHKEQKCTPHTNWCSKYEIETNETSCKVCSELEGEDKIWLLQNLRAVCNINKSHKCIHFKELDEYEEKKCCGGRIKRIKKVICTKKNSHPNCNNCKNRKIC